MIIKVSYWFIQIFTFCFIINLSVEWIISKNQFDQLGRMFEILRSFTNIFHTYGIESSWSWHIFSIIIL